MKKLAILVLFALACGATSAKGDVITYNCTGWNFSFSFSGNPGSLGPDPGTCVLQTGANYSSISPLRGTFSVSNDPEENGEPVSFVFNTGAGTLNVNDDDGDFAIPSAISSFSRSGNTLTINFTIVSGTYTGGLGVAHVFLAPIPEPGTLSLFGAGLGGLAGLLRRKLLLLA